MKIEKMKWITRAVVRANPDKLFLFGDNYERTGFGGQAKQMRGEPNAYGIATKTRPDRTPEAYFTDDKIRFHAARIYAEIQGLKELFRTGNFTALVIPENGIGAGRAELQKRAPKCFEYLQQELDALAEEV